MDPPAHGASVLSASRANVMYLTHLAWGLQQQTAGTAGIWETHAVHVSVLTEAYTLIPCHPRARFKVQATEAQRSKRYAQCTKFTK